MALFVQAMLAKVKTTNVAISLSIDSWFINYPHNQTKTFFTWTGRGSLAITLKDTHSSSTYATYFKTRKNGTLIEETNLWSGNSKTLTTQTVEKGDVFNVWSQFRDSSFTWNWQVKTVFTKNYIYWDEIICQKAKVYELKSIWNKATVIAFGRLPTGERRTGE